MLMMMTMISQDGPHQPHHTLEQALCKTQSSEREQQSQQEKEQKQQAKHKATATDSLPEGVSIDFVEMYNVVAVHFCVYTCSRAVLAIIVALANRPCACRGDK